MPALLAGLMLMPAAVAAAETVTVAAFADGKLDGWSNSVGAGTLAIADAEDQPALRAAFRFSDAQQDEPIWITRRLDTPQPRRPIHAVHFRYRWEVTDPAGATTAPVMVPGGFKIRLRTSPTTFTDFDVPLVNGGYPAGAWVEATVDTRLLNERVRNIYGSLFSSTDVIELTFRLDDVDEQNASGFLWLADIRFEVEPETAAEPYTPQVSDRTVDQRLDLFEVHHGSDGFYDFAAAARLADPEADVLSGEFRGLHFPVWNFPGSREALLRYDVIALGDVDPWILTSDQVHWLADAVRSGVGLLVCAGPNSFGQAKRHPPALLDLLPVTYEVDSKPVAANQRPTTGAEHELTAGLDPALLGSVRPVVSVTPKDGAEVLLRAGDYPLLVSGQAGKGRVLVLTSWAQPSRVDDGTFMVGPAWHPFAARMLAWLAGRELPPQPSPQPAGWAGAARWLYSKSAVAPGGPFGFVVRPATTEGTVKVELVADDEVVWSGEQPAAEEVTLHGTLPDLAAGALKARILAGGKVKAELSGRVVDPFRRDDFYPLICYLPYADGGHFLDLDGVTAKVDEIYGHGFNTIAVGGLGANAGGGIHAQSRGRAEERAFERGMASILEYTDFTAYRRDQKYEVSPLDPRFEAALAAKLAAGIEQARYVPRLLSVKFIDEPTASPALLDDGQATKDAYRALTGHDLKPRADLADDPPERYGYGRFLSQWLERDFATGQRLKTAAKAPWDLLVTYMTSGYGSSRPLDNLQDAYHWSRPADRFDFDVYPYFYPTSDRIRFVQADWCFAASRTVSRALGKPWGFYVELDDRNWPYQKNPAEASAECAFTAVGAGAEYLNSFIFRTFATGCTSRPERWELAGRAFRTLRDIGPLLAHAQRQPARVAVLWPETQQIIANGYTAPLWLRALLSQAVGDCDVLHEDIFATEPPPALDALALAGVSWLRRDAFGQLVAWVDGGGVVMLDTLPERDEKGDELDWPAAFRGDPGWTRQGTGWVCRVASGWAQRCRDVVESGDDASWLAAVEELDRDLSGHLRAARGVIQAKVTAGRLQTDVGIRTAGDCAVVTVVNHAPSPQAVEVVTSGWPFKPGWLVDLTTGQTFDMTADAAGNLVLRHTIPGRWAWLVGVYSARPDKLELAVATPQVARGAELRYTAMLGTPGCYVLDLAVTAPDGTRQDRLGGARAAMDGTCAVAATMAVNAPRGRWTITARAPQVGLEATVPFEVR